MAGWQFAIRQGHRGPTDHHSTLKVNTLHESKTPPTALGLGTEEVESDSGSYLEMSPYFSYDLLMNERGLISGHESAP